MDAATLKYVLNLLREGTIRWEGRRACLDKARVRIREGDYKNGKAKWKWYWRCASCKELFRNESDMEVDHIVEVGSFCGDLGVYAKKMYDATNLQALCVPCHQKKTAFNARIRLQRGKSSS